ncbi:uncharacterized protein EI90DRAFT_1093478 [Cantharellus anzutake]|uniref:uncharacterized protein n=1 Tax=Cantharellus anzutake TaxID=1750568 RepID=UPI0019088801|nr:uncharacterized protein EI90DRAFT_1093478 [Cantharellus anzutake]KAF8330768.1 hypothetical protein EI90DRAFT_1093478 [Cantharellus anzutake]
MDILGMGAHSLLVFILGRGLVLSSLWDLLFALQIWLLGDERPGTRLMTTHSPRAISLISLSLNTSSPALNPFVLFHVSLLSFHYAQLGRAIILYFLHFERFSTIFLLAVTQYNTAIVSLVTMRRRAKTMMLPPSFIWTWRDAFQCTVPKPVGTLNEFEKVLSRSHEG